MIIKILESNDNIQDYMDCVKDLNSSKVSISSIEEIKETLVERPSNILTFVLIVDERIVATSTIIMEKKLRYQQVCCHIEDVGVHPDFRGKGYGKKIVEYCVGFSKTNNCYKVKLNCSNDLIEFYQKLGFDVYGNYMWNDR